MRSPLRTRAVAGPAVTVALAAALLFAGAFVDNASAARSWSKCSLRRGDAAARQAGLAHALNSDRVLERVFSGERPSDTYRRPSTSLCGDFNGDGVIDRAVHYQCSTVSSPAPWLVLRRR